MNEWIPAEWTTWAQPQKCGRTWFFQETESGWVWPEWNVCVCEGPSLSPSFLEDILKGAQNPMPPFPYLPHSSPSSWFSSASVPPPPITSRSANLVVILFNPWAWSAADDCPLPLEALFSFDYHFTALSCPLTSLDAPLNPFCWLILSYSPIQMLPSRLPLGQLYPLPNRSHSFHGFRGHLEWGDSGMCSFNSHCPLKLQIDLPLTSLRNLNTRVVFPHPANLLPRLLRPSCFVSWVQNTFTFPLPPEKPLLFSRKQPKSHFHGDDFPEFLIGSNLPLHRILFLHGIYHNYFIFVCAIFLTKIWNSCPRPSKLEAGVMLSVFTLVSPDLAHWLADGRYPLNIHCFHSNNRNNCDYKSLSTRDWTIELGLTFIVPFNL